MTKLIVLMTQVVLVCVVSFFALFFMQEVRHSERLSSLWRKFVIAMFLAMAFNELLHHL